MSPLLDWAFTPHDWEVQPYLLLSNPPQQIAECRVCGKFVTYVQGQPPETSRTECPGRQDDTG